MPSTAPLIAKEAKEKIRLILFHLLAQKEGCLLPERMAEQIAAVMWNRAERRVVLANPQKPAQYSYHPQAELAAA